MVTFQQENVTWHETCIPPQSCIQIAEMLLFVILLSFIKGRNKKSLYLLSAWSYCVDYYVWVLSNKHSEKETCKIL